MEEFDKYTSATKAIDCSDCRPINTVSVYVVIRNDFKVSINGVLEANNIIVPEQSGFYSCHSCAVFIQSVCETNDTGI